MGGGLPSPPFTVLSIKALCYDLRDPDWPRGDDTFLIICHDSLLIEMCLKPLHKGDMICIEGRLVLTLLRSGTDLVPLAEILASTVLLLKETAEER